MFLGGVTVHQDLGKLLLPFSYLYCLRVIQKQTQLCVCVCVWSFKGKRVGEVNGCHHETSARVVWHRAIAAFPVKGVVSPPESDAKLESGNKGGVGQHLPCWRFLKRSPTGQAWKTQVLLSVMVGKELRDFPLLNVSRKTEHLKGHYHSHSNGSLFLTMGIKHGCIYSKALTEYIAVQLGFVLIGCARHSNNVAASLCPAVHANAWARRGVQTAGWKLKSLVGARNSVNQVWNSTMQCDTAYCQPSPLTVGVRAQRTGSFTVSSTLV